MLFGYRICVLSVETFAGMRIGILIPPMMIAGGLRPGLGIGGAPGTRDVPEAGLV
jgi:hypothetical protein